MSRNKHIVLKDFPRNTIFTVGHSTLAIADFIALLQHYGIKHLVDIRTIPRSRHNPQFNGETLAASLRNTGIMYTPIKALGGMRKPKKDSLNGGWHNTSFRGYADYMQTDAFIRALEQLIVISQTAQTAIMCAEAVPWRCHRSLIADALTVRNIPVEEILSAHNHRRHTLTSFAHAEGTHITYPPKQGKLLL